MAYDDDRTRRLPPTAPVARAVPLPPETVVVDDPIWRQEVIDRLATLRTILACVAVLAVVALGIGVWALVKADDASNNDTSAPRGRASAARVQALSDRVNSLKSQINGRPTDADLQALQKSVSQLNSQVGKLQSGSNQPDTQTASAVNALNTSVKDLGKRVDALEQAQADASATPTP